MAEVTLDRRSNKRPSRFETLMARAAALKSQNASFAAELDAIVARMENTVRPKEAELAKQQIPLLKKLLTLGQRKSLTQWQRETLHDWIQELQEPLQAYALVDEDLMDDFAHYDAYRMGITLEDDSTRPHQQIAEAIQQAQQEHIDAVRKEADEQQEKLADFRNYLLHEESILIESELDRILGPAPEAPESNNAASDLFADELDSEQQRQFDEYHQKRSFMQQTMLSDKLKEINQMLGLVDDDDEYDYDENDNGPDDPSFDEHAHQDAPHSSANSDTDSNTNDEDFYSEAFAAHNDNRPKALSNEAFQRLFRATAGKLHPDREPDETLREAKQKLMAELLAARKKGDVMTVLTMYEEYVGTHEGFSKSDQSALTASLEQMLDELEAQQQDIVFQSPAHSAAYHLFYDTSPKKVDTAFARHLKNMEAKQAAVTQQAVTITSLKSLKPELEERYDEMTYSGSTLDELIMRAGVR